MRYSQTDYGNNKNILKFPDHYIGVSVTIDDTGITANAEGKKIVSGGTILGGGFLSDPTVKAAKATSTGTPLVSNAEGVLLTDVDVTGGPAPGAALIHGFVDLNKIPTAPTAEEKAALLQISFIK